MTQEDEPPGNTAVSLFLAIGELPEAEREHALAELGQRDPQLASEVKALLVADAATEGPLERARPEVDRAAQRRLVRGAESSFPPPERIGAWRLIEKLGVGGMGEVWLSERIEGGFAQQAALKLVRTGMASEGIVARFLVERQVLARLNHPAIAKVLDGGLSPDGRPWFAMEPVWGRPITVFAQEQDLSFEARVRLMTGICRAVDFAHRNLVIHRDLKPSNILVTDAGEPKLLDFGLAKLLRPASGLGSNAGDVALTASGALLGTPAYMSPEQVLGADVTTGADVYSLGAVLYELLVGRPPFVGGTTIDILRQVLDGEPEHPRAISADVDSDLQTICLKCLDKDPSRRYGSAAALADDLERWVRKEPIAARPPTVPHRLAKWVRRKPAIAALAALLAVAVGGGLLGVVWQWHGAVAARDAEGAARRQSESTRSELAQALLREREARGTADRERLDAERARAAAVRSEAQTADALHQAQGHLYASQIALAQREWSERNLEAADTLLDACPPGLRAWEWKYLKRLCSRRRIVKAGHTGPLAFSSDGRLVASRRGTRLVVWNARTGRDEFVANPGTPFGFRGVAFSPDGRRVATTAGGENLGREGIVIWDLEGCISLDLSKALPGATSVAFSRDGRWLAGARGTRIKVWDAKTADVRVEMADSAGYVTSLAFSPDGTRLFSVAAPSAAETRERRASGHLRIWDATTGAALRTLPHPNPTSGVAISDDGRVIASAGFPSEGPQGNEIRLWDADTGRQVRVLGPIAETIALALSSDGRRLVSIARGGTLKIWDTETGQELLTLQRHGAPHGEVVRPSNMSFDPYSRHEVGEIAAVFAPDGEHILASQHDAVSIWDASVPQDGVLLQGHSQLVRSVAFAPDGLHLASSSDDGTLKVWTLPRGLEVQTAHSLARRGGQLMFSRDGSRLTSTLPSGVEFWDVQKTIPLLGAAQMKWPRPPWSHLRVDDVVGSVSPDGRRIAAKGYLSPALDLHIVDIHNDAKLALRDAALMDEQGRQLIVEDTAWSSDGRLFAAAAGTRVSVWNAQSGRRVALLPGHRADQSVDAIAFDSSARMFASASGGEVRIWDTGTWRERLRFRELVGYIPAIAFSPDGDRLVTAGSGGDVRLWETSSGREMLAFYGRASAVDVAFSPDGMRLATGYVNGTVMVWNAAR